MLERHGLLLPVKPRIVTTFPADADGDTMELYEGISEASWRARGNHNDECPISFDVFQVGDIVARLSCGHVFARKPWLDFLQRAQGEGANDDSDTQLELACPMCKRDVHPTASSNGMKNLCPSNQAFWSWAMIEYASSNIPNTKR